MWRRFVSFFEFVVFWSHFLSFSLKVYSLSLEKRLEISVLFGYIVVWSKIMERFEMAVSTHSNISGALHTYEISSYETCAAAVEKKSNVIFSNGFAVSKLFSVVLTFASLLISTILTMVAQLFLVSKDLLLGVSLILGLSLTLLIKILLISPEVQQS